MKQVIPVVALFCLAKVLQAQPCTGTGHTPSSAILLCGSDSYTQSSVPLCGQTTIPVPCNGSFNNMNPTWFKMACFSSGTLGFVITPANPGDNYNWQLFDITGRNNDDVFTDPGLFVACNWSPEPGETGASGSGNSTTICSDAGSDLFSKMPDIIQGHEYLLLVSQYSNSASGFQVVITGGSASVTDPVEPDLFNARLSCDGTQLLVLLNKKMICSTVAPDGSDFSINAGATIISASPVDCFPEGVSNYVILSLSNTVSPGNYTLTIKNGGDGNTIRDKCGRNIPAGNDVPVLIAAQGPALPDSIRVQDCTPDVLRMIFSKPIQCNSIAGDGSDFIISGPQTVVISNITFTCNTSNPQSISTSEIQLHLAAPLVTGGAYNVVITTGSDGSPLADECGNILPAGSLIPFIAKPSVSASFMYDIRTSCKEDTARFFHSIPAGVTGWQWNFGGNASSDQPNPVKIFSSSGDHIVQLIVTNGTCSDTAVETISLNNRVTAAFDIPPVICPGDTLHFINKSSDNADRWEWKFSTGFTSTQQLPPVFNFPITGRETFYDINLTVINSAANCRDSITKRVKVLSGCYIAVPTAFTPNNDGLNDYLHPLNALKAENLVFRVFNRLGQLVFETRDWTRKWDGRIKGILQATGVYAWMLSFIHRDTGEKVFMKGTTVLIR
jgi:gliding motility-associated-like protein